MKKTTPEEQTREDTFGNFFEMNDNMAVTTSNAMVKTTELVAPPYDKFLKRLSFLSIAAFAGEEMRKLGLSTQGQLQLSFFPFSCRGRDFCKFANP